MATVSLTETITKTALLGVDKTALPLPEAHDALSTIVAKLDPSQPDATLLGAAALDTLYHRAGRLPRTDEKTAVTPCDLDDLPRCSARAELYLAVILGGEQKDLLPEWLEEVAKTKRRVSERYLPDLLTAGRQLSDLRPRIAPVLGKRGRWLAAQNPEWSYSSLSLADFEAAADSEEIEFAWQSGTRASRAALIAELRTSDSERARALVQSTWASDSADERLAFVNALETGLSLADEPFLESALDDRSKGVRAAAANLLAKLPGSHLVQRMIERADALITIKRNIIGQTSLEVCLPETLDTTSKRDGIEEKSPLPDLGEKAWWLTQIIAAASLTHWQEIWKKNPEQCLTLAGTSEWREAFFLGWGKASRSLRNAEWQEVLTRYWLTRKDRAQRPEAFLPSVENDPDLAEKLILEGLRAEKEPLSDFPPGLSAHPAAQNCLEFLPSPEPSSAASRRASPCRLPRRRPAGT